MKFSYLNLRMIIGSVSDYIVRNCKCPVFVIKDGDERRPSAEPKPQATTSDAPNSGSPPLASAA